MDPSRRSMMPSDNVAKSKKNEDDEASSLLDEPDPADVWMQRGARLRQLRELELQDEAARRHAQLVDEDSNFSREEADPPPTVRTSASSTQALPGREPPRDDEYRTLPTGDRILEYDSYLAHQRYYDDLKHVDYRYIQYAVGDNSLVIEQDKTLGKGGFCWDAAFILGEHVVAALRDEPQTVPCHVETCETRTTPASSSLRRVVELGCGTGLCGMMVAKAVPHLHVYLTDLPELMPLLARNVQRNFASGHVLPDSWSGDDVTNRLQLEHCLDTKSPVAAQVLDWEQVVRDGSSTTDTTYDVILGADVVASLYDPLALAETIHVLAHARSVIWLSFKERLSSVHRAFEQAIDDRFEEWSIHPPNQQVRNRNPDVRIISIRRPKGKT